MNVTVRITNSDLLAELPSSSLETVFPSLIGIAASGLTGSIPTIALPSVPGFALDDFTVQRVQTSQDDFLGIFATIKTPTTPAPLVDWSDPAHPHLAGEVKTVAKLVSVYAPSGDQLRANFDTTESAKPALPSGAAAARGHRRRWQDHRVRVEDRRRRVAAVDHRGESDDPGQRVLADGSPPNHGAVARVR